MMVQYRYATEQTLDNINKIRKLLPTLPISGKPLDVQFYNDTCYMGDRITFVAFEMDDQFVGYDGYLDIRNIISPIYTDNKIRAHIANIQSNRVARTTLTESPLKGGFESFYATLKEQLGVSKCYITVTDDFVISKPEHLTAYHFYNPSAQKKNSMSYFLENTHARRIYSILRQLKPPKEKKLRVIFCFHTHPILSFALVGVDADGKDYIRAIVTALCEHRGEISIQPIV